jgi:hypothetical protein
MKKITISLLLLNLVVLNSCKEELLGQYPIDSDPPGKVTNVVVKNIEGGALIFYDIPGEEDALYVRAVYHLDNGSPMEIKSSIYSDQIEIVGIGKSRELPVILTVVDRSQNESEPVTVMTHPLNSPIYSILESMSIQNDFGGIQLKWKNPTKTPIIIDVYSPSSDGDLIGIDRFYSESSIGKANVRGQEPVETIYEIVIRDRWGNLTDIVSGTYLPIFEVELDKSKFRRWNPPGIPYNAYTTSNWYIENLWNNSLTSGFANYELQFTFDLGAVAKLSRFRINQRPESNLIYDYVHPKIFELWGSESPNVSADFNTWKFIGTFESIKPSGLPLGQASNEDIEYANKKGEEWNVPLEAPPVRYIRFVALETWGQGGVVQFMEMTLWGNPDIN